MDQMIYLFTSPPLFSAFLCTPGLVSKSDKEGDLAGTEEEGRYSLMLGGGKKSATAIF